MLVDCDSNASMTTFTSLSLAHAQPVGEIQARAEEPDDECLTTIANRPFSST